MTREKETTDIVAKEPRTRVRGPQAFPPPFSSPYRGGAREFSAAYGGEKKGRGSLCVRGKGGR